MRASYIDLGADSDLTGWYYETDAERVLDAHLLTGRNGAGQLIYDGCPADNLHGPFASEEDAVADMEEEC